MAHIRRQPRRHSAAAPARQRGLTLIEFMISIVLGMILVAALAALIADQSSNRAEVDRAGRLIENGRYAIRTLADDLQMAGYLGEISTAPTAPAAWATPCGSVAAGPTKADVEAAIGQHVVGFDVPGTAVRPGYNDLTPLPGPVALDCLANIKPGTDVVVLRRADADYSGYETAGAVDPAKLASAANPVNSTRVFIQTGLNAATNLFEYRIDTGGNNASFVLKKKDKIAMATVRRVLVRIYYVTSCSVCTGTPDAIPSLKMRELVEGPAWSDPITIAEGVENLQVEWGMDTVKDGAPDGADVAAGSVALADWPAVVSAKIYLLARSIEATPGYTDTKTYPLGLAGTVAPAGTERSFKRHVFVQSVRLVNPSARRSL